MNQQKPALWQVRLNTSGVDSFNYCLTRNILGIGWRVSRVPATPKEYLDLVREEYKDDKGAIDKGAVASARAISVRMQRNELGWTMSPDGIFYLGRIVSIWRYEDADHNRHADVHSIRDCEWRKVILRSVVPEAVRERFNNPGPHHALESIHSDPAHQTSRYLYNLLFSGQAIYDPFTP